MIVLDEQLKNASLIEQISSWYRGNVADITSLRPVTVIKDDAIPVLLRQARDPTFVTINSSDFWQQVAADMHFCITCFPLPDERVVEISNLLRNLFSFPEFRTRRARRGKVAYISHVQIRYYQAGDSRVYVLDWPTA